MKKIILLSTLSILFFANYVLADDKSTMQKGAVNDALNVLPSFKLWMAEEYLVSGKCLNKVLIDGKTEKIGFIGKITATEDCALHVEFKESASIPDLSKETLTLKMIITESHILTWSCSFTGKNKQDLPALCQ